MYGFLLALIVLDGIFLAVVILLQSGKGGGLAAMGGGGAGTMTEGILAGRQATTLLTRSTWTAGTLFIVLALVLSIMSSRAQRPESVIQVDTPASAPAPEPVLPGAAGGGDAAPGGADTTGN
jgi:preprotein translocase subunit SecG